MLGSVEVEKSAVLYVALEDSDRRLYPRLGRVLHGRDAPEELQFQFELSSFDEGGLKELKDELDNWGKITLTDFQYWMCRL